MFLRDHPDFVFTSGDGASLRRRLAALVAEPERLRRFFDAPPELPDMAAHLAMLDPAAPPGNLVRLPPNRSAALLAAPERPALKEIGA
jgi:hypothetical protein